MLRAEEACERVPSLFPSLGACCLLCGKRFACGWMWLVRMPVPRKAEVGRDESCRCRWSILMRDGSRLRFTVRDCSRMMVIIDISLFQ